MRWLVFFLVVLNGLVFVWFNYQKGYNHQADATERVEQFDFSAVSHLELLAELSQSELQQRDLRLIKQQASVASEDTQQEASAPGEDTDTQQDNQGIVQQGMCLIVGSYPEVISARQVRIELAEKMIPSKVVEIAKKLPAVSWVYIPPQANRKDALLILKSLQDKKIDSFLMNEPGEYQYAISLGFYGNADSARSVQQERKAQGYNAQLAMRVRERKAYWLGIDNLPLLAEQTTQDAIELLLNEKTNVKKQEISCDALALMPAIN